MKITNRVRRPDISVDDYHALDPFKYLNHSNIRYTAAEGPWRAYHDRFARLAEDDDVESDALRLGRIFHLAQERPDWLNCVRVLPSVIEDDAAYQAILPEYEASSAKVRFAPGEAINLKSPFHRAYIEQLILEAGDKTYLTGEEYALVVSQVEACLANPAIVEAIQGATGREVVYLAETNTSLILKALIDVDVVPSHVLDWKTTRFNSPQAFVRDAVKKGYKHQAAHYLHVTGADAFFFAVVTKTVPCEAMLYQMPPDEVSEYMNENDKLCDAIAGCIEFDSWHAPGWGASLWLSTEGLPI